MPTEPADYDPKPFVCQVCGWILGESYREPNQRITQLRVYRLTRPPECSFDLENDCDYKAYVVTRLNDGAVVCAHCGNEQSWYANQTAIAEMLGRISLRKMEVW
jgi:hypothetical protein